MRTTEKIKHILIGIDKEDSENNGWWETRTGAIYGAKVLRDVLEVVSELDKELKVTDELLADRQKLLDAIPECKTHGKCIPHALDWIEKMKSYDKEK